MGSYGIRWNDDLDIDVETIYEEGRTVRLAKLAIAFMVGEEVMQARTKRGLTQKQLSEITGIDQSDLSKIERGMANVSVSTLNRIANALDYSLSIRFYDENN
ncbi:MAG: helix-turn-helix transcriptional regulator [Lachnospiraceae bacterium]|nr:helix-turn-helix transcriptional regulator [Lachnospiraceae bacterium]